MQASGAVNLRGLKALVIGLGILVVLGTALVIGVAVKRLLVSTAPEARPAAHPPVPGSAPFATTLPKGRIAGIAAANGMVAIRLRDGAGGKVVFVDPRTGAVAGTATSSR